MSQRIGIALAAAAAVGFGAFAASGKGLVTFALADTAASQITDISAQAERQREGPRPGAQRPGPRPGAQPQGQRPGAQPQGQRPGAQRPEGQRPGAQRPDGQRPGAQRPQGQRPGARVVGPRSGPRLSVRIRAGGPVNIGGRRVTVIRDRHVVRWRGRPWNVVPIVALGALTIGAIAYAPYAYVPVGEPVCTGYTADGCFLRWAEVPTVEGELIPQCVTYCPR